MGRNVDLIGKAILQRPVGTIDAIFGQISHRVKFDGAGGHREGVADRPAASAAAADQRQADCVIFRGMHPRHVCAGKHRGRGDCSAEF